MRTLLNSKTSGWGAMRLLRLFLVLLVVYQSFMEHDYLFLVLGALLVLQTLLVAGCGIYSAPCDSQVLDSTQTKFSISEDLIEYEEVTRK